MPTLQLVNVLHYVLLDILAKTQVTLVFKTVKPSYMALLQPIYVKIAQLLVQLASIVLIV